MAGRGRIPSTFDGIVQSPGMLRHGSFPGLGLAGHHPFEPLPPPELLENKMAVQAAEIERLIRENQRLASTHVALREELVAIQQEMQRVQAHMGSIQTESDIQMRSLLEKSAKMKADIRAGGSLRKDLQQAHVEAQSLITARQELNTQIKQTTLKLQQAHADAKKVAFEYEKGSNIDQVERMHAMERNLISMAREVEKLRAEVLNAEKRARAPNSYGGAYGSPDAPYPPVGQGGGFVDAYGRPQVQMSRGTSLEGTKPYGSTSAVADAVIVAAAASGSASGGWGGTYDTVRGVPFPAQK
ncbi:protein FLX-like protein 4 isoform X1 [Cinnamomum micranthum f. kanehirae]|uniref:Protein FLX-like protein 4 isoform X1 n=1 Tax=Cinnamomum micranthum f. kanehirae TaxID=337451 RepID=A0A443N619_9MAGN|nr:protein FLX-like protein 4 isoform X1 [Cinnamomum micranthum f. kanehirae]